MTFANVGLFLEVSRSVPTVVEIEWVTTALGLWRAKLTTFVDMGKHYRIGWKEWVRFTVWFGESKEDLPWSYINSQFSRDGSEGVVCRSIQGSKIERYFVDGIFGAGEWRMEKIGRAHV